MPLNIDRSWPWAPRKVAAPSMPSHSETRSRLTIGGSYFRSRDFGVTANLIKIGFLVDGANGVFIAHHTGLKADEQIFGVAPGLELMKLGIQFDEEVELYWAGEWRARKQGISWQIVPSSPVELGTVQNGPFSAGGVVLKANTTGWNTGASIFLRPRTRRYTLAVAEATDPVTMLSAMGGDIEVLRGALNGDTTGFVTMPVRGTDKQDKIALDDLVLAAFDMTSMKGGDGLPPGPTGLDTGPDRAMVHLNYRERDSDGDLVELNQVLEWVGDSATSGAWGRYA